MVKGIDFLDNEYHVSCLGLLHGFIFFPSKENNTYGILVNFCKRKIEIERRKENVDILSHINYQKEKHFVELPSLTF